MKKYYANKLVGLNTIVERRIIDIKDELRDLHEESAKIDKFIASPKKCLEYMKQLNNKDNPKDFDKIGRIKSQFIVDVEQSLNEKSFRVNKVTHKNLGWSDTAVTDYSDPSKRRGRKGAKTNFSGERNGGMSNFD